MANTFHQNVEYFPRLDHQKNVGCTPSSPMNWDASSNITNYQSGFSSINTMQITPATPGFSNYDISGVNSTGMSSSIASYTPKVTLDTFNLGGFEDWICWENHSNRGPSLSPTKTIKTTVTTSPVTYFKSEASQSPNLSSAGLENTKRIIFDQGNCITEERFMDNANCYDGQEVVLQNSLQKPSQNLSRTKSFLSNQKDEYSFQFSCSPELSLHFINADKFDKTNNDYKTNGFLTTGDDRIVGSNALLDLSFVSQGQNSCRPNSTTCETVKYEKDDAQNEIKRTHIDSQNAERFETESNDSEEVCVFSTSLYSFQSYAGPNSQKSTPMRAIPRKRKSRGTQDTKQRGSDPGVATKNLCCNGNADSVKETRVNGMVHNIGRTKTLKKTAHNMIEKRYRTNLNDKIAALRNAVPSLRASIRNDLSFVQENNRNDNKNESSELRDDGRYGNTRKNGNLEAEIEDLRGLTVAHKLNKATILTKAAEYIAYLEKRNRTLLSENSALETRICAFEKLKLSVKGGEGT